MEAGRRLAAALESYRSLRPVVLGLPRGGVPVAFEVAEALDAPLDVIVVRKLGVPYQPELAMGAIGEGGVRVLNEPVVRATGASAEELHLVEHRERQVLEARARSLRGDHAAVPLQGRTAIVVDDGIATGATARAACLVARAHGASRVVLAAPVGSPRAVEELRAVVDDLVCPETPEWFAAVGQAYRDFGPVPDAEVSALLTRAARRTAAAVVPHPRPPEAAPVVRSEVPVEAAGVRLVADLVVPATARGMVLFAHGSGSSRRSPRNRHVAGVLNRAGLGTLLLDLLTPAEDGDRRLVFDIELLAGRLVGATHWWRDQPLSQGLSVGYFGASTGAAAALWAAADPALEIDAVVSRGGRPDLAARRLSSVTAPTLLIVGGHDDLVLDLNQRALRRLSEQSRLVVVPGATHLFEEAGTLDRVAELASEWFGEHLVPTDHGAPVG